MHLSLEYSVNLKTTVHFLEIELSISSDFSKTPLLEFSRKSKLEYPTIFGNKKQIERMTHGEPLGV